MAMLRGQNQVMQVFTWNGIPDGVNAIILSWKKVGPEARNKLWDEITRYVMYLRQKAGIESVLVNFSEILEETVPTNILPNQDTPSQLNEVPAMCNKETEGQGAKMNLAGRSTALMHDTCIRTSTYAADGNVKKKKLLFKVSLIKIHPINSSADEEGGTTVVGCDQNDASIRKEMQKRETVKSVGGSIRLDQSERILQVKIPNPKKMCQYYHKQYSATRALKSKQLLLLRVPDTRVMGK
ncbi:hypothetical protein Tco_0936845 [Tanacetum coccineum]|uniref:Uncharacterized protein n=1 Tax=Tanacetum coccineum TaxID=301880 RepID=A0ABQ5DCI3_9ASTR